MEIYLTPREKGLLYLGNLRDLTLTDFNKFYKTPQIRKQTIERFIIFGFIKEVSIGRFKLTEEGKKHAD